MASSNPNFKARSAFKGKNPIRKTTEDQSAPFKKKKKWVQENKFFQGSVQEGLGFAFKRKQKVQQKYERFARKQKQKLQESSYQVRDDYPEHLRHLYKAEEERLKGEEQLQQKRKKGLRSSDAEEDEEEQEITAAGSMGSGFVPETLKKAATPVQDNLQTSQSDPKSPRKWTKMSSYQKTKAEYERRKEEHERKKQEFLKDKAQREEALKKYKEKKTATYQLLKKKTKKGQPNLNLQMELLLQKIQTQRK